MRSAEFVELRRASAERKATRTEPLSLQHQDGEARAIGSWARLHGGADMPGMAG